MYELQGECDAIRQGRVASLATDTVRMASDEVVKADLMQVLPLQNKTQSP